MAVGILAAQSGTVSENTPVTIYTCPAGVSHAVVHIFYAQVVSPAGTGVSVIRINGNTYYRLPNSVSSVWTSNPLGASLILSPGDVISIEFVEGTVTAYTYRYTVHVSGYTVS
jgi:hypothetical protein